MAQTRTSNISVKKRENRSESTAQLIELPERKTDWGSLFLHMDTLVRNFAVVGGLVLVMIAVKNSASPEAQSVFNTIQESTGMRWDESIGKLSFVNSLLPEEIQTVWAEKKDLIVLSPADGDVIHAWTQSEPYMMFSTVSDEVCAAASGEVMSVAHGLNEERIIRLRHTDCETVYGNLKSSNVEVGDYVEAGSVIGRLLDEKPLAFEMRVSGFSVDPYTYMKSPAK